MASFRDKRFRYQLEQLLRHDPASIVREKAAWALDQLRSPDNLQAFITALHDADWGVRSACGWGLVHLGTISLQPVAQVIKDNKNADAVKMATLVLSIMNRGASGEGTGV
jgi:HEAT repeat protein